MKLLSFRFFAVVIALALFVPAVYAQGLTKISDHVYAYVDTKDSSQANSFGANAGVIIGDNYIAVVDTLLSEAEAQQLLTDIRALSDKPIKYAINTHYHRDHSSGNAVFAGVGAKIVAQEKTAEKLAAANAETGGPVPDKTFEDALVLELGNLPVELSFAGYCHSPGDTIVTVPTDKVLFAGDILFTGYHAFIGEGDIANWAEMLDYLQTLDFEKIIPGHGPLSGMQDLKDMRDYILLFDQKAKEFCAESDNEEEITKKMLSVLPERPEGAWLIGYSLKAKYLQNKNAEK